MTLETTNTRYNRWPALLIALFGTLLAGACSPVDIQPDESGTFADKGYRYYTWANPALPNATSAETSRRAIDPTVRREVNQALQEKGYQLDAQRAQFSIGYRYGIGTRDGVPRDDASNITYYPPTTINRKVDQASRDNAIALGGVKETKELQLRFRDIASQRVVWEVTLTEIAADANRLGEDKLDKSLGDAIPRALRSLPDQR